jgi:ABC-2 type transport system permease protein
VVNFVVLPMAFLSGAFGPTDRYPNFIQDFASLLPLHHLIELLSAIVLDGERITEHWGAIAVVAAWGAVGYGVAARYFGWEPRHGVT